MDTVNVDVLSRDLRRAAEEAGGGRAATTVHGGHHRVLRQTVLALTGGQSLAEHESPGEATVLVLDGHVRLVADQVGYEGTRGDLLVVPAARHRLDALEPSTVLLTVAKA